MFQRGSRSWCQEMFWNHEQHAQRLVERIGRILKAERCLIMLHDPAVHTLHAIPPALGFTPAQLFQLNDISVNGTGVSAEVLRDETPIVIHDTACDPRAGIEGLTNMGVRNGVSVPLISETRDDDCRLIEKRTIGVLHAFNKRHSGVFDENDVQLLQLVAQATVAAVKSLR